MAKSLLNNIVDFQKEFQDYVNQYEKIRELSLKVKITPSIIIDLFYTIGMTALTRTEEYMEDELRNKLLNMFSEISDDDLDEFVKKLKIIIMNWSKK